MTGKVVLVVIVVIVALAMPSVAFAAKPNPPANNGPVDNPGQDNGQHDNGHNQADPDGGGKNESDGTDDGQNDGNNGGCGDDNNGNDDHCAPDAPPDSGNPPTPPESGNPPIPPQIPPPVKTGRLTCVPQPGSVCEIFRLADWRIFEKTGDALALESRMLAEHDGPFSTNLTRGQYVILFWNPELGHLAQHAHVKIVVDSTVVVREG